MARASAVVCGTICVPGGCDAPGIGETAVERRGAVDCRADGGLEADAAGDHQASSRAGACRDGALRARGTGEPVRARSAARGGDAELSGAGVGGVGCSFGQAKGFCGALSEITTPILTILGPIVSRFA